MGRIRTVKPEFFIHEGLQEMQLDSKMPLMLVFLGLLTQADREGRFKWQPKILKLAILPFIPFDMETALDRLVASGHLRKYEVDGRVYGDVPTFADHQNINSHEKASVFPAWDVEFECMCLHLRADVEGKGKEGNGKRKGKAPSESELAEPPSPEFLRIPLNQGEYAVRESEVSEWESLYPAVDVKQELREVLAWNKANPTKRKTKQGVAEHIRRWLSKAQDMGGNRGTSKGNSSGDGTRGAAVGRVERGQSAFRAAAIASVEASGGFPAGPDDSGVSESGAPPGHREDVPARSGDVSGGVRDQPRANGSGVVLNSPEILPPSQRNTGGLGSHGSQRAH